MNQAQSTQDAGHAAHTQKAGISGLPGEVSRPIQVTFLGAGSGFCPTLCRDVLMIEGAERGELRLVDIDAERLGMMHRVIERVIEQAGRSAGWTVVSSTDRREVLPGTDYAVCCVEVSGLDCVAWDNDIPLKYGVDQCIGDTIGPGGLFKGLRTVPVFLEILRDMAELCPQAVMLNYTNPMSMMMLAAGRAVPEVAAVGLCHSVQGTSQLLADYAGVACDEMDWRCAGINHLAWFTQLEHDGRDLYTSVLNEKFAREVAEGIVADGRAEAQQDLVRKDMCLHFGAFITESSGHLSEYLPYYRKSDAGRAYLGKGYHGESKFYATNWPSWREAADAKRGRMLSGEEQIELERSWEYGSWIIEAIEKDAPFAFYGNVMNSRGLIENLPSDGCVEVRCVADAQGVRPERYGKLPAQMANVCAMNMGMFDLAATAAIEKSMDAAIHALLLDPLCAALLTPGEIKAMAEEMFEAEADYLQGYA